LMLRVLEERFRVKNSIIKKSIIIIFWLAVWQAVAALVDNDIVLVGPIKVIGAFIGNIFYADFVKTVLYSFGRITAGFVSAFILGLLLGSLSYKYKLWEEVISPLVLTLKAVPVASFVVLLLIWFGSSLLSFFVSAIISFPIIYNSVLSGLKSTDQKLVQMADFYNASLMKRILYLYRSSISSHLISGIKSSVGLSWKSGVAAEVIGMSRLSIGERIYTSKIYLDTAGLFSWTLWVILLSFALEKLVIFIAQRMCKKNIPLRTGNKAKSGAVLNDGYEEKYDSLSVLADDREIIKGISFELKKGNIYALMGDSGKGKTSLLFEIYKRTPLKCSFMFQENRLLEDKDAITNILFGALSTQNEREEALDLIRRFIPNEMPEQLIETYSGGMKRRVAFIRALMHKGDMLLLDEPFAGVDEERKRDMMNRIIDIKKYKIILIDTHEKEDATYLDAKETRL